jgi:hypothetical protein
MKPKFSKTSINIRRIVPNDEKSERYDRDDGEPMTIPNKKPTEIARKKAT